MAASARISVAVITPCPPMPTTRTLVITLISGPTSLGHQLDRRNRRVMDDGARRTRLDAQRAAGTYRRFDAHESQIDLTTTRLHFLGAPRDVDGRAADVDTVAAARAFVFDDLKGLQL